LKVPVIPLSVNLAEKERYGLLGLVGFFNDSEEKRMKYWSLLGPTLASTMKSIAAVVRTLTDAGNAMGCKKV
jgi:hypothetical protein